MLCTICQQLDHRKGLDWNIKFAVIKDEVSPSDLFEMLERIGFDHEEIRARMVELMNKNELVLNWDRHLTLPLPA